MTILQGDFGRVALLDMDASLIGHAHPHYHLIFKAAGSDQHFVVGDQMAVLTEETLVAVNSWQPHAYVHRDSPERTTCLALYIEPGWLTNADRSFATCAEPGFFSEAAIPIGPRINRLRASLVQSMAERPSGRGHDVQETILDLCLEVAHGFSAWRSGRDRHARRGARDFRIGRAICHMREHAAKEGEIDAAAKASGLSRPHFNHLFRGCTGVTPHVYLNALRVEATVDRLRTDIGDMGAIADDLGFSAQSNFTRFFRQHTGTSPSQFRRVMAEVA